MNLKQNPIAVQYSITLSDEEYRLLNEADDLFVSGRKGVVGLMLEERADMKARIQRLEQELAQALANPQSNVSLGDDDDSDETDGDNVRRRQRIAPTLEEIEAMLAAFPCDASGAYMVNPEVMKETEPTVNLNYSRLVRMSFAGKKIEKPTWHTLLITALDIAMSYGLKPEHIFKTANISLRSFQKTGEKRIGQTGYFVGTLGAPKSIRTAILLASAINVPMEAVVRWLPDAAADGGVIARIRCLSNKCDASEMSA